MGHVAGVKFFLISQSRLDIITDILLWSTTTVTVRELCTQWFWSTTLFKIEFGSKTSLEVKFFGFFTSKNMPPYGTCGGCKFFFDISKST